MNLMQTFNEFLNEAKLTKDGYTFEIKSYFDSKRTYIQFIPNSKTLDSYSEKNMISWIEAQLMTSSYILAQSLTYDKNANGAGICFYIDADILANEISKKLGK